MALVCKKCKSKGRTPEAWNYAPLVVCYYDTENEAAQTYAYSAEGCCSTWDNLAKRELGLDTVAA